MTTIVLSYPTEPGVCAEQTCEAPITDIVTDGHWYRKFGLCRAHAEQFEGITRRQQQGPPRCPHKWPARDNGNRPPDPPDWCVRPAGHDGDHRMWNTARHG